MLVKENTPSLRCHHVAWWAVTTGHAWLHSLMRGANSASTFRLKLGKQLPGIQLKKNGVCPIQHRWVEPRLLCHKRHRPWVGLCLKEIRTADEHGSGTLLIEINAIKSGSSWHLYKGRCYSYSSCLVSCTPNSPQGDYWRSKVSLNNSKWLPALPKSKPDLA